MSKSKGNVVTPFALLEEHGLDGVRCWADEGGTGRRHRLRCGADGRSGRRLAVEPAECIEVHPLVSSAGAAGSDHGRSRPRHVEQPTRASCARRRRRSTTTRSRPGQSRRIERAFWRFCDDYLEFVKKADALRRAGDRKAPGFGDRRRSSLATCSVSLRFFAPYLPFATEEVSS